MDDEGIVINNSFKRLTFRSNDEFKLATNLTLGVLVSFTQENNQNVNLDGAYNDAYRAAPVIPGIINGKYGNTSLFQNVGNPILDINNSNNRQLNSIVLGNAFLEYRPVTGLTLKSSIGVDDGNLYNRGYTYQFFADSNTFIKPGGNQSNSNSTLNIITGTSLHWIWDNTPLILKHLVYSILPLLLVQR